MSSADKSGIGVGLDLLIVTDKMDLVMIWLNIGCALADMEMMIWLTDRYAVSDLELLMMIWLSN